MKTNHQRGFRQEPGPWQGQGANGYKSKLFQPPFRLYRKYKAWGDSTNGKHGLARRNRGAKKFDNSRNRFATHALEKKLMKQPEEDAQ